MAPNRKAPAAVMLALSSVIVLLAACSNQAPKVDEAIVRDRSVVIADRFQAALQQQLRAALAQGGPVAAVSVCKEAAPAIAASESAASGAIVRRVALRNRNPQGGVPEDMRVHYDALAAAPLVDGQPASRVWTTGTGEAARVNYLRAIPMQAQPCSTCHGVDVAPAVSDHIRSLYPDDLATGFEPGELRGALLVSWSASALNERTR